MVEIKNLTVQIEGQTLYKNFSMQVNPKEKVILAGASGSGKTTLINLLLGFMTGYQGEIFLFGKKLNAKNIDYIRSHIAYVPQELNPEFANVQEMILTPFRFKKNKDHLPSDKIIVETLEGLNLTQDLLAKGVDEISGGQKQRAAIASALLLEKPLLILDEPTSALDSHTVQVLAEKILKHNNQTVLSTSHNQIWSNQSDKIINLDGHGKDA